MPSLATGQGDTTGTTGAAATTGLGGAIVATGGAGGIGSGGVGEANCGLLQFQPTARSADIMMVLDRSGSMKDVPDGAPSGSTTTKWQIVVPAMQQIVTATQSSISWALKTFPEAASDSMSDCAGALTSTPDVPMGTANGAAMNAAITVTTPDGNGTPTGDAIKAATAYLKTAADSNPKYLLLATDGEPTCGGNAAAATTAVSNLAAAGIPVYVIGIATEGMADAALSSMAMAGGRPRSASPPYYPVQTAADLSATLSAIGGQIASCSFSVRPPDPPADPNNVAVKANGSRVPKSDTDGWRYGPDMTSIELTGTWCDQIQSGAITDLEASFACAEAVIP